MIFFYIGKAPFFSKIGWGRVYDVPTLVLNRFTWYDLDEGCPYWEGFE